MQDDRDFQRCFYSETALLVQSFHSVIRKLETFNSRNSNLPVASMTADNGSDEISTRSFEVCIETWDATNRDGEDASVSYKTATGWTGTLYVSEVSGGSYENRQIALSRERLQLNWLPMWKKETVVDLSTDEDALVDQHPSKFSFVGTVRGGTVTSQGIVGISILQVAIIQ